MGREARLRQAGILKTKYSRWIICNKIDLSYEVSKGDVAGIKIVEKIVNVRYMPFLTLGEIQRNKMSNRVVLSFKSVDEATDYLKEIVNNANVEQEAQLYKLSTVLVEARNVPVKRKLYGQSWSEDQVLSEVPIELKKLKSSKLL